MVYYFCDHALLVVVQGDVVAVVRAGGRARQIWSSCCRQTHFVSICCISKVSGWLTELIGCDDWVRLRGRMQERRNVPAQLAFKQGHAFPEWRCVNSCSEAVQLTLLYLI